VKYFTMEWWKGGCEGAEQVFSRYEEYFLSIRTHLPPALVELYEGHTLHDSEVKRIVAHPLDASVTLELLGWDINLQRKTRYIINFLGVISFEQLFPQDEYVEQELGDIGYWECELLSSGMEVRLLFVSGAVFAISFSNFEFSATPVGA
jgi:hypothetical protein